MSEHSAPAIQADIIELSDQGLADRYQSFFRTGKGGYGEGDLFRGIRVPVVRKLVRKYRGLPLGETSLLLHSRWHEDRLFALLMMVDTLNRRDAAVQKAVYSLYMASTAYVNNWDLVDTSASHIAGAWLFERDRQPLHQLAVSENLWEKRISIIATQYFIRKNDFEDTLLISRALLHDDHDLIHKAVGWMLREVGNRDMDAEERFLKRHYRNMPRTMLRYAIEKFPECRRQDYLKGRI